MIVVDTSALISIILEEPEADECSAALVHGGTIMISAGTLAEALIVAGRKKHSLAMRRLITEVGLQTVPVSLEGAHLAEAAYARWGKGVHPASLNFGDCFAYALAKHLDCPLLFVGEDFAQTDVRNARTLS